MDTCICMAESMSVYLFIFFSFRLFFFFFSKRLNCRLNVNMFHQTSNWCVLKTEPLAKACLQVPW